MEVDDKAASGPETGDTGTDKGGISAALDKALAGFDDEGDVPLATAAKAKGDRSAKAVEAEDDTDAKGKAEAAPEGTEPSSAGEGAVKTAALEPPKHWPAERKQAFSGLPAEAQKAMLSLSKDLEGGFTRKSMEVSDKVKFADAIGGLLADDTSRAQLAQAGMDEVGYVRYLHSLQRFATSDPVRYVAWAMQSLGVRPEHLGIGQQQPAGPQQTQSTGDPALEELLQDPAIKELRQALGQQRETVEQLRARLEEQDRREQALQHQHRQARANAVTSMWQEFRTALDDHGQPAYPHADTLMRKMGAIMDTDPEIAPMADGPDKLAAAYEAAMWATPSLRTGRLDAEKAAAQAAADKAREAEKAKKAAGPRRAMGAPTVPVKRGGIGAALDAAFSQHGIE